MRDANDPQLLGQAILNTMAARNCKVTEAADYLYQDMRERGWSYAIHLAPAADPLRLYQEAQERRRAAIPTDVPPQAQNGSQALT